MDKIPRTHFLNRLFRERSRKISGMLERLESGVLDVSGSSKILKMTSSLARELDSLTEKGQEYLDLTGESNGHFINYLQAWTVLYGLLEQLQAARSDPFRLRFQLSAVPYWSVEAN